MSTSTVRLLQVAAEITGGESALARELGIAERLLQRILADHLELPDPILLRIVDIILAYRGAAPS